MSAININIVVWCVVLHVSFHTQVFIYNIGNYIINYTVRDTMSKSSLSYGY